MPIAYSAQVKQKLNYEDEVNENLKSNPNVKNSWVVAEDVSKCNGEAIGDSKEICDHFVIRTVE